MREKKTAAILTKYGAFGAFGMPKRKEGRLSHSLQEIGRERGTLLINYILKQKICKKETSKSIVCVCESQSRPRNRKQQHKRENRSSWRDVTQSFNSIQSRKETMMMMKLTLWWEKNIFRQWILFFVCEWGIDTIFFRSLPHEYIDRYLVIIIIIINTWDTIIIIIIIMEHVEAKCVVLLRTSCSKPRKMMIMSLILVVKSSKEFCPNIHGKSITTTTPPIYEEDVYQSCLEGPSTHNQWLRYSYHNDH